MYQSLLEVANQVRAIQAGRKSKARDQADERIMNSDALQFALYPLLGMPHDVILQARKQCCPIRDRVKFVRK
jgi:hypothetical protein